jgi:hypothetical protein
MPERYDDDRNRERDRDWDRGRDAGQRYDDWRREWRGQGYDYDRDERARQAQRSYGDMPYGSERSNPRWGSDRMTSTERDWNREGWGSREDRGRYGGQYSGGMGSYSGRDWRTNRNWEGSQAREDWSRGGDSGRDRDRGHWDEQGDSGGGSDWTSSRMYDRQNETGWGGYGRSNDWGMGRRTSDLWSGERYTGGRFSGRGPKGYRRSDDRILEEVCERLTRHPEIDASEMEVRVVGGEVTLTGGVEDRHMKRLSEDVAEEVSGVTDVHNELKVTKALGQRIGEALGLKENASEQRNFAGQGPTPRPSGQVSTASGQTGSSAASGQSGTRQTTEPARR